ncbi:ras-like protein [Mycena amicta]|nr:ras-like protein [Mycena amicta]
MSRSKFNARDYNLVVVGGRGVGKTALSVRFIMDHYDEEGIDWNIDESLRRQCVLDDDDSEELAFVNVLDPDPRVDSEYLEMRQQYIMTGHGFLFVYAVDDRGSFEQLAELHAKILLVKDRDKVPVIVVASKCDLKSERLIVGDDEGRALADHLGSNFIEASAKEGKNVDEAFLGLVREVRKQNPSPARRDDINPKKDDNAEGCCCVAL